MGKSLEGAATGIDGEGFEAAGGDLYRASLLPPYEPHLIKEGA